MTTREALNILRPTGQADLKRAFRDNAKKYHPDHFGGNNEFVKLVNLAHATASLTEKLEEISY